MIVVEATIADLRAALECGEITSVGLVQTYLDRIETFDKNGPRLNAVPVLNPDALMDAQASDARRANGETHGPLDGIPYTAKNSFKAKGMTVAAGSPAFTDSLATTFHLRYSISPVHTNPQLVHTASLPAGLSSRWYTTSFLPESGICTLAPSATHNGTNQFLTAAIYGHSGTAPQDGIPVTLRIALSRSQYQNLNANLHLINLTYQCL